MTREEIAKNARRLLKDAEILFAADRYESAIGLAVIAIEEVGKIIVDVLSGTQAEMPKEWHKEKQRHVGLILTAQVCAVAIGEELVLPRTDDPTKIHLDDELAKLLYPQEGDDRAGLGRKLGQYLFFKSGGSVDGEVIRRRGQYQEWLVRGELHRVKNRALYADLGMQSGGELPLGPELAEKVLEIAQYAVRMCRRL
jgi:AbiV family abortive infection protein